MKRKNRKTQKSRKKHRSEVIAVTLYEYSEEEHRRIQERDKAELKKQLAEAETNLRQSENQLAESKVQLKQAEARQKQSETKLEQSEAKLTQAIQNTISILQTMGYDDSLICTKLCEIYQVSEAEARFYLKNN